MKPITITEAFDLLDQGKQISHTNWEEGVFLRKDLDIDVTFMHSSDGSAIPYTFGLDDILTLGWYVYEVPEVAEKEDNVKSPKHYAVLEELQAKHLIASVMNQDQWLGYCLGNIMKYRLRAGEKGDAVEDLAKAKEYAKIYEELKDVCKK